MINKDNFKKYEALGENIIDASNNVWNKVYEDIDNIFIKRSFTEDYECSFHSNQTNLVMIIYIYFINNLFIFMLLTFFLFYVIFLSMSMRE
ncbi:hypothetical protein A966_06485 [Brachyspira hampsonii 30446]|uniref:Uncharacterized protein n=1 Tax=Brachyspira hampsonii 30446 TaxID=1289135 RepID=A0A2U4FPM9_9SPIR|nr:hypothetical protein [Brachyspira hampsonii]EKV57093.1 hypothetical protein A966_06485 [Brachyspira hampsonii 30446]MBW5393687.1 hypothetical protein [Brachyspira hampsonii]OEJ16898.1 hypothetical protein A9495_00600 [Brachyspira hampsonii]